MKPRTVRRILVALDASHHSEEALRAAADVAERLSAELHGIFVVDAELMRVAALPESSETGLTSATRRALNPRGMERALEAQASRAQAALESIARRRRLRSSFRLLRGNVISELLSAASGADLMALGMSGHMGVSGRRLGSTARGIIARASCSVLLLTLRSSPAGESVVVVYGGSEGADRALEQGIELARQRTGGLVVVLYGAGDELPELAERARQIAVRERVQVTFDDLHPDRVGHLGSVLERHGGGLLVVPGDSALIEGRDDALTGAGCPVLLTR